MSRISRVSLLVAWCVSGCSPGGAGGGGGAGDDGSGGTSAGGHGGRAGAGGAHAAGGSPDAGATGGTGGAAAMGGSGGAAGSGGAGDAGGAGHAGGTAGAAMGGQGGSAGAAGAGGQFPNGGQQYKTVVNIVDAQAAKDIEAVLRSPLDGPNYARAAQAFYALYSDEYDFLYFFLDHDVPEAQAAGSFEPVTRAAIPGTGIESGASEAGFGTRGRLRGVAGFLGGPDGLFGPVAHETMHYWAQYLDPKFGFGKDHDMDYGPHWGLAGIYGQLGGFDPATLRCANPAGAMPPACKPESNGRFRYVTSAFAPHTNSFKGVPYAPLELYLAGLVPLSAVPASFPLLMDASLIKIDPKADSALVEASGVGRIDTSAIVSRHGMRAPATEAEKHFTGAFVVVSATPAPASYLEQVVLVQEVFGKHTPSGGAFRSFEDHTGGRATLATRIGRRRTPADPAPLPPVPATCQPLAQDCGLPGVGCYGYETFKCQGSGGIAKGAACKQPNDCAPGLNCVGLAFDPTNLKCVLYCDWKDATSAKACGKLCPNGFAPWNAKDGTTVAATCLP